LLKLYFFNIASLLLMAISGPGFKFCYSEYYFLDIMFVCVLVRPRTSLSTEGLRRSKRTKLPLLRHYAGERPIYELDKETSKLSSVIIKL